MKWLSVVGLTLIFAGSTLLFFFSVPRKQMGDLMVFGPLAMRFDAQEDEADPGVEDWMNEASTHIQRARKLSQIGFGMIAIGSLFRIIAVLVSGE